MQEAGHSKPVHWDDPEGWDVEGRVRGVPDEGHMYTCGWFMSMCGENHYNIVEWLVSNKISTLIFKNVLD